MLTVTANQRVFLTLKEASKHTTLSEMSLRRLARQGKIRFLRPTPNRVLIDRQALDEFLRGCVAL